jgi:hypothetical protein
MAVHALSEHFRYFNNRLNPGASFEAQASSQYATVKGLIEDPRGLARALAPRCFLQGSYKQATAIHTINDLDIVALCELWQPASSGGVGTVSWSRDQIFQTIAAQLLADGRYAGKVRYGPQSMCIKVDLGLKIELLPVVYKQGTNDSAVEPFRLFRPGAAEWQDGYARYHQAWLTWKNGAAKTGGNFIPAVKVLKHLRSTFGVEAVSFHLECLLFHLPDEVFRGGPADYIPAILAALTGVPPVVRYVAGCKTPCGDRDILSSSEWALVSWQTFHDIAVKWARAANAASGLADRSAAISLWRMLLGEAYFPLTVSP